MSSISDTLRAIAVKAGIDPNLFVSVAEVESSLNPNAVGDKGTSFGLFQLHRGGQAPSQYSDKQLLDPALNARLALPGIQQGISSAGAFNDSLSWFYKFAVASGHPGNDRGLALSEAAKIKTAYDKGSADSVPAQDDQTGQQQSGSPFGALGATLQRSGIEILFMIIGIFILIVAIAIATGGGG